MRIAIFDSHKYDMDAFETANTDFSHHLHFFEPRLTETTAQLANGFPAVCAFVNDRLDKKNTFDFEALRRKDHRTALCRL